jgi:uncharacterized protein YacL
VADSEGWPDAVVDPFPLGTAVAAAPRGGERAAHELPPRGLVVEVVRLIIVVLFSIAGWEIAAGFGAGSSEHLLVGIVLGSGVGYVIGGAFGRRTVWAVSDVERALRRVPASEILAGSMGLVLGLVVAVLVSVPLFHLPPVAAYTSVTFDFLTLGFVGYRIGTTKSEDLFALFGVKPRAAGTQGGEVSVLDTSAILDSRLLVLVQMGFVSGTLVLSRGVLEELQTVADSSDSARRARGRRALDQLVALKRDPLVEVVLVEEDGSSPVEPVDARLVRLAKNRGGALITNDAALAKVAAALDVPVRSIHALAAALRPEVIAGDTVEVRLTRRGRDSGQAVGYLDDGTMVVVEQAQALLGDTVSVSVTNVLRTSTGQMVFARVGDGPGD